MKESIENELRAHYEAIQNVDPRCRAKLLAELAAEPQSWSAHAIRHPRRVGLRAALIVGVGAVILLSALIWSPSGSKNVLWAEVNQKLRSAEALQFRWLQKMTISGSAQQWNYATVYQTKHRTSSYNWAITDETSLPSAGTLPDSIGLGFEDVDNHTSESYSYDYKRQRFFHNVTYRSVHYPVIDNGAEQSNPTDLLEKLVALPPEAAIKRGREHKFGREVATFEVIDLAKANLSFLVGATTAYIFVDVKSHLPIAIEGAGIGGQFSRIWNIEVNQFAASVFDVPPLPEDVDAEEEWKFWLPAALWEKQGGLTFRLTTANGKTVLTEKDFQSGGPYVSGTFLAELLPEGIEKLDGFMARNPGASIKIEIAGEPPIERKIFGRLARQIGIPPVQLIGFGPPETWGK